MSFTGVCHICESAEGRHTCSQCGALVCVDHYESSEGICAQCATAMHRGDDDVVG